MPKETISGIPNDWPPDKRQEDTIPPALIQDELRRIISSRHFRTSRRGKEFLQYVVNQKISGHGDQLKERLIGVEIFGRKPDYATGEDPVVRVQAGDVRRRLERYHADTEIQSGVLIQIPLGSYTPVFLLKDDVLTQEASAQRDAILAHAETEPLGSVDALPREPGTHPPLPGSTTAWNFANAVQTSRPYAPRPGIQTEIDPTSARKHTQSRNAWLWLAAISTLASLALALYLLTLYVHRSPSSTVNAFWAPASISSKPVLLCLPKPIVYKPSEKLFERYEKAHPNALATREARHDQVLQLDPAETIQWGDMIPIHDSGPGLGAVVAGINISRLLTEQNIRFNLRFGDEATYAEMRDSPVVIIGAINTDWTPQLTSELNLVFDETPASPNIHETGGARRVWKMETRDGQTTRDYGMITRQLSSKTGQFLVQVAGISHFGTEAASEMLANELEFTKAVRSESISLQKKNLQIVVSTDVTGGRAGPPHVVAISSW